MASYLVTGAAGFIGARVTELLLTDGHTVVGIDNLNDAYDVRVKTYRLSRLQKHPAFTFLHADISERAQIVDQNSKLINLYFDAVINLAARAGVRQSLTDPWVYVSTNTTGTLNLLEYCREQGIPKFILASTSSFYGTNAPLPTPDEANSDRPLQAYAASKKGAESLCHVSHHLYGIDVTHHRYGLMATLSEIIAEKTRRLTTVPDEYLTEVERAQKKLFPQIVEILNQLSLDASGNIILIIPTLPWLPMSRNWCSRYLLIRNTFQRSVPMRLA